MTEGRSLLAEFYCGYTRNLADQAATGRLDCYDALFLADHCIQLIGAADVVRAVLPEIPVFFGMLISSMSDTWAPGKIAEMMGEFRDEFGSFAGRPVTDEALASSIRAHNRDRQLIRRLFDERSSGSAAFTPRQLQDVVAASMVMDPAEHHALLAEAVSAAREAPRDDRVRVHLSAHLCHAPKRELLDLIEDSGAIVVDDDLFHGRRYVSTDVDETGDPINAISFRVFGKQLPIFNISHPFLWGNKPDAGYLQGEEWESASRYVADQLRELISFLEAQTGRPFDYDALSEAMTYIKRAAELRREGLDLCKAKPAPATFWDWIACVAPINFLPGDQALVDYFAGVRDEIAERLTAGVSGVRDEKYRLYFDGIMNWNKLGFLSRKFAEHGAAVLCGRYIHNAFWQEPQLIDTADPILGMAQHYLLCPTNHGTKTLDYLTLRDCREYDVDGIVFHSTRTCRAFTGPQRLLAKSAQGKLGIPAIFFEGDVADASFYKEEILESRLVAMLEAIDVRRARGSQLAGAGAPVS